MSEGSNFKTHTGGKAQKPRRPSRPFIVDETPIIFSLEWLSLRGLAKFGAVVTGCYLAVDITRFLVYRMSPNAVPLQPSWTSEVVSNTVQLVAPCRRFPDSDLVFTETAVVNDTATYFNPQEYAAQQNSGSDASVVSATIQEELRHHRSPKEFKDRVAEVRALIGFCADKVASSLVLVSGGVAPSEMDKIAPPKDETDPKTFFESHKDSYRIGHMLSQAARGNFAEIFMSDDKIAERKAEKEKLLKAHLETSGYKGDPFAFDAPSSRWPSKTEQDDLAKVLSEEQIKRKSAVQSKLASAGKSLSKPGVVSFTSTHSDNLSDDGKSGNMPDFYDKNAKVSEHLLVDQDSMENQLKNAELRDDKLNPLADKRKKDEISRKMAEEKANKSFFKSIFAGYNSDENVKDVSELPHREGTKTATIPKSIQKELEETNKEKLKQEKEQALMKKSSSSGSEVKMTGANSVDDSLSRFMSLHFEPRGTVSSGGSPSSNSTAPTELRVKCLDASSSAGGTRSRCSVDANVLCAPRHRAMLAALAMLPDPLPTNLQVATFGVGPTALANFMFKNFAGQMKRLDVVAEPAMFEHPGVLDFGLTARHGPVYFYPAEEEKFLLRTDRKYDLLFVSAADRISGERGTTRLDGDYLSLIRKSLSSIGVAAIEMNANDLMSQRAVQQIFGKNNVYFAPVRTNSSDLVALAAYSLPEGGVWKRHIVHRSEDISYSFRLPYDIAAHLPLSWELW